MMRYKKALILGFILIFAIGMLAACGGEVNDDVFEEEFEENDFGGEEEPGGNPDDPFGSSPDTGSDFPG